jgi:hypothetical protein
VGKQVAGRSKSKVAASLTVAEQLIPLWLVSLQATAARSGRKAPEVILTTTNSEHAISAVRDGAADLDSSKAPVRCRDCAAGSLRTTNSWW